MTLLSETPIVIFVKAIGENFFRIYVLFTER